MPLPSASSLSLPADPLEQLVSDIFRLQGEVETLRRALAAHLVVDQAKGMVMSAYGLDADRAFGLIAQWAQELGVELVLVAEAVVATASTPSSSTTPLRPSHADLCGGRTGR